MAATTQKGLVRGLGEATLKPVEMAGAKGVRMGSGRTAVSSANKAAPWGQLLSSKRG